MFIFKLSDGEQALAWLFPEELPISQVDNDTTPPTQDETGEDIIAAIESWDIPADTKTHSEDNDANPLEIIQRGISDAWPKRLSSRYDCAIVLLISWEEHDLGDTIDKSVEKYKFMFRELYNYDVWQFKIPSKKPRQALAAKLAQLAESDSPNTLFVIWYDGHGGEHPDRRGPPMWCSHQNSKESQIVDSGILSTNLGDCEADILIVNNACESLTCDRFAGGGVVESISASAFNTRTYGSIEPSDLSPSLSWAALKILSSQTSVDHGITAAELHRRICLATQWAAGDKYPDHDEFERDSFNVAWQTSDTRTQPVYTRLSADAPGPGGATRGIVLCRLGNRMHYRYGAVRVRVNLDIDHLESINPKEWIDWLITAPCSVMEANLEMDEKDDPVV